MNITRGVLRPIYGTGSVFYIGYEIPALREVRRVINYNPPIIYKSHTIVTSVMSIAIIVGRIPILCTSIHTSTKCYNSEH